MKIKPNRYIILDTNIFQHLGNETLGAQILEVFKDARSKNYGLALSQFSILELVDTSSLEIENKRMKALSGITHFHIRQNILMIAGRLGCLYQEDGINPKQQPEKGDKIIGATAINYNALIYTTNGRDFPQPYFKEVGRHYLQYKKNGQEVVIIGYFMEPDLNAVIGRYANRINDAKVTAIVSAVEDTEK